MKVVGCLKRLCGCLSCLLLMMMMARRNETRTEDLSRFYIQLVGNVEPVIPLETSIKQPTSLAIDTGGCEARQCLNRIVVVDVTNVR